MAMVKKSITVTDQQDQWIKTKITTGHYGNESEVVRELIRERQLAETSENQKIAAIHAKLVEAEQSGFTHQTPEQILQEIKNGLGRDA